MGYEDEDDDDDEESEQYVPPKKLKKSTSSSPARTTRGNRTRNVVNYKDDSIENEDFDINARDNDENYTGNTNKRKLLRNKAKKKSESISEYEMSEDLELDESDDDGYDDSDYAP